MVPSTDEIPKMAFTFSLDERVASVFIYSLELPLHSNLRRLSTVKDELSEISFFDQVLKVPSEGVTIHCEVDPSTIEGAVVSGFRSLWVLWERSTRVSDPSLVLLWH